MLPNALALPISALLSGLAGGVACTLATLMLPIVGMFWLVPVAAALGALARWQGFRGATLLCANLFAVLIAFTYAQFLSAATRIADALSTPLQEVLLKAGVDFVATIAWANLRWPALAALALALIAGTVFARPWNDRGGPKRARRS